MRHKIFSFSSRLLSIVAIVFSVSACVTRMPEPPLPQQVTVHPPEITVDPVTGEHSVEIDILIYNVAGLPWPISNNRTKALKLIGAEFAAMRERKEEPDIVLIQEGFMRSTKYMIKASGYPNWVRGPRAGDKMPKFSERAPDSFKRERRFWKGERFGKVLDSGLYVLSNWPILSKGTQPFYRYECAGFDCGANKGILRANIKVPGMPGFLQVMTTHLNSREASGVSNERSLMAHNLQIDHLDEQIDVQWTGLHPLIFGGDFNMKGDRERLDYAVSATGQIGRPAHLVQHYCTVVVSDCDIRMSYDGDEPWLDTQDLQAWISGTQINVRAIMIEALFDEPHPDAPKIAGRHTLSDHDGLLVRYRLSWVPTNADGRTKALTPAAP